MGVGEEETLKNISEQKMVGFSSSSLFPARKREAVTRVEPFKQRDRPPDEKEMPFKKGDRPPDVKENPVSQYRQRLEGQARPQAHSRYIPVKQE